MHGHHSNQYTASSKRTAAAPPAIKRGISVVHNMSDFGLLQACTLPDDSMRGLRLACQMSPCDAIHTCPERLFEPRTMQVLQQACHGQRTALAHLPDGFALYAPESRNALLAIIKDSLMWLPKGADPAQAPAISPDGARVVVYSVVHPPTNDAAKNKRRAFRLVFHDGCARADEISRFSLADHAIAQMAAAIPLDPSQKEGRVFMEANGLGALMAQCLVGADADLLKRTFLGLVRQAAGSNQHVFDTPIETSDTIAKLLQFKSINGQLSLGRCKDGIIGYTHRRDGRYSLMFVATSDDINQSRPAPREQSVMHVFKVCYANPSPDAPRIFVHVNNNTMNNKISVSLNNPNTSKPAIDQDAINSRNNFLNNVMMMGNNNKPDNKEEDGEEFPPPNNILYPTGGLLPRRGAEEQQEEESLNELPPPQPRRATTKPAAARTASRSSSRSVFDLSAVTFEDTSAAKEAYPEHFNGDDGSLRIVPENLTISELLALIRHVMHETAIRSAGCGEFADHAVQNAIAHAEGQVEQHPWQIAARCELLGPRPIAPFFASTGCCACE